MKEIHRKSHQASAINPPIFVRRPPLCQETVADELPQQGRRAEERSSACLGHSAPFGFTLLWDLPYYYDSIEAFDFRIRIMKWEAEHPAMKQVRCMKRTRVSRLVYRIFTPKHPADLDRRFPPTIHERNLHAWLYFMGIFTVWLD